MLTVKRKLSAQMVRERLGRQYGEDRRSDRVTAICSEQKVDRALSACRTRRCIIVIDGEPMTDLDAEVDFQPETRVQFIRLVPLQGG